jgi:hypothetical protein
MSAHVRTALSRRSRPDTDAPRFLPVLPETERIRLSLPLPVWRGIRSQGCTGAGKAVGPREKVVQSNERIDAVDAGEIKLFASMISWVFIFIQPLSVLSYLSRISASHVKLHVHVHKCKVQ